MTDTHSHSPACLAFEIPRVYDGVLYWRCWDGEYRNEWAWAMEKNPHDPAVQRRFQAAEEYIERARR